MKNIIAKMTGTNTRTDPTPATTPSVRSEASQSGPRRAATKERTSRESGPAVTSSSQSAKGVETSNVSLKTSHMAARKSGIPRYRFSANRSIRSVSSTLRRPGRVSTSRLRPAASA
jgi:hypothetical protein